MTHKLDFSLASSETIEDTLSQQIEAIRLKHNITQQVLADMSGVSRSTITRLAQDGKGISFDSLIRIMQALNLESHLKAMLPDPNISPLDILKSKGKSRQRARLKKREAKNWTWDGKEESS